MCDVATAVGKIHFQGLSGLRVKRAVLLIDASRGGRRQRAGVAEDAGVHTRFGEREIFEVAVGIVHHEHLNGVRGAGREVQRIIGDGDVDAGIGRITADRVPGAVGEGQAARGRGRIGRNHRIGGLSHTSPKAVAGGSVDGIGDGAGGVNDGEKLDLHRVAGRNGGDDNAVLVERELGERRRHRVVGERRSADRG